MAGFGFFEEVNAKLVQNQVYINSKADDYETYSSSGPKYVRRLNVLKTFEIS